MDEGEERRITALAVPSRRRLLEILGQAPAASSVPELAARLELHPNTVRLHLDVLRRAGLVESVGAEPGGTARGRPPTRYRAVAGDPATARARAIGEQLAATEVSGVGGLVALLEREGMDPAVLPSGARIDLRRCPYATLAAAAPATICGLHQAVLEGFAGPSGLAVRLVPTGPPCTLQVRTNGTRPGPADGEKVSA
jgi:predicted ArsR family transcriptional regulator